VDRDGVGDRAVRPTFENRHSMGDGLSTVTDNTGSATSGIQ